MKRLIIAFVLLLSGCIPGPPSVAPKTDLEREEYAVYSSLINSEFATSPFVTIGIDDNTLIGCSPEASAMPGEVDQINPGFGKIADDALSNWKMRNVSSRQLRDSFSLIGNHLMVNSDSLADDVLRKGNIIVLLSSIGFNASLDQAFVCAGFLRRPENQTGFTKGYYFWLAKENGIWVVKEKNDAWIS